jgi:glycosyltransferase involved in cell wall biosynthesis
MVSHDLKDLRLAEETKTRELDIYSKADLIITVTEEDAKDLVEKCPNLHCRVVPNIHCIMKPVQKYNKHQLIFVGGFDHLPNVDAVIFFCNDVLPILKQVFSEMKLTVVGGNPPKEIRALENESIAVTGYVPTITPYLQRSYISIAPLRYGAGMKGKIGEAMAHGLPVVTTSVGAEGMGLVNKENAMIADNAEDFSLAIIDLIQNDHLYMKIKGNALVHISQNFTDKQASHRLKRIFTDLATLSINKLSLLEKIYLFVNYGFNFVKKKVNLAF